jgi:hypothetical protein
LQFSATAEDGFPHYLLWQATDQLNGVSWQDLSAQVLPEGTGFLIPPRLDQSLFLRALLSAPPIQATNTWPEALGNHRAVIEVTQTAPAVYTMVPWRQPVLNPALLELAWACPGLMDTLRRRCAWVVFS